jgi:hypothetical protein
MCDCRFIDFGYVRIEISRKAIHLRFVNLVGWVACQRPPLVGGTSLFLAREHVASMARKYYKG